MRKIAVVNFKGGTGKTTTVVNVGAGLAKQGQRVLLIDVDAQGSLSLSLGVSSTHTLSQALTHEITISECITKARKNLYLIPSDNSLLQAQRALAQYTEWQHALGSLLRELENEFDWILLDCAASITLLNINALTYANEIFIPTQVEYLSLAGLNQVLENLARIRSPNRPRDQVTDLGITLILPTMYDMRKRVSRQLLQELRETYGRRVAHPIRINVRLSEAPSFQQTIFEYAPTSRGSFDYSRLVDLLLQETLLVGEATIGLQRPFQPRTPMPPRYPEDEEDEEKEEEMTTAIEKTTPDQPEWARRAATPNCPYCDTPLSSLEVAGYRVYRCDRCGYQKQVLQRDLRTP
ncbi:MAG: AAA family ATPase [Chloroflexia bacterium]|nr:AAA family ATPase [Chloroflexia bacterium]